MPKIIIIAEETEAIRRLAAGLAEEEFTCMLDSGRGESAERLSKYAADVVLIEMNGAVDAVELCQAIKQKSDLPAIALSRLETISTLSRYPEFDDFVIEPYNPREVATRAKRLVLKAAGNGELIKCGELTINSERCEVTVANQPVILTFKEYELLRVLASNPGRVFTREILLDRVWGQDYFGGDRTVDVHIRRLRSKIEDPDRTFIETVRNVGYRFTRSYQPSLHDRPT